jgi:hypothetical protein
MSSKNEALELRTHLFKQMDRLSDPTCNLELELKRADALAKVGTVIVNSHKQEVDLLKLSNRPVGKAKTVGLKSVKGTKQISNG